MKKDNCKHFSYMAVGSKIRTLMTIRQHLVDKELKQLLIHRIQQYNFFKVRQKARPYFKNHKLTFKQGKNVYLQH